MRARTLRDTHTPAGLGFVDLQEDGQELETHGAH
jgi:hypothetical protein